MSGEKTEPPTPKRLKDARKKGQVCKSNDLTQAFLFMTGAAVLSAGGGYYVKELAKMLTDFFQPGLLTGNLSEEVLLHQWGQAWLRFLLLLAPLFGALVVVSAAVLWAQVQTLFAFEILTPKLDKLNPIQGFQNLFFKAKTYIEAVKNLLKFAVVLFLVYKSLMESMRDVILSARMSIPHTAQLTADLMFGMMYKVGGAFVILGVVDYWFQKKEYMKGLKMSKYEVEKEFKQDEGDPHIKHQRRALHEEMLHEAAIEHVPKSNVVVVNPTHLAIAMKYDEKTMQAPQVTAKGQNRMAQTIIQIAKENKVPIMRNVPLAHSLFELEVGRDIPEDLYEAVAEVLNWVYQLSQQE
jgi:flagellar biosynthetic protein FlhB